MIGGLEGEWVDLGYVNGYVRVGGERGGVAG